MYKFFTRHSLGLIILGISLCATACCPNACILEPTINYTPPDCILEKLPSCFPHLSFCERQTDWGREMWIGDEFAHEMDFYRAITSYKRALILIPKEECTRRQQILYNILLSYYLANRYCDAIKIFEEENLKEFPATFPAFREMILILYDCYEKNEDYEKAELILKVIDHYEPEAAEDLSLASAIKSGDLGEVICQSSTHRDSCEISKWISEYEFEALSVRKAQFLNAILPGAGYYYVGQKSAALTSFLINAAFIYASYQFFDRGYPAAGLITASLEYGWYMGGINGAGLAAKEYNERLYSQYSKAAMIQHKLFPILMFECAF